MSTITVNSIRLYYELQGAGEPLVLIGGLGIDTSEYEWMIEALAKNYHVLALDNRGAGRTDKPDAPYTIEMMADDTAGLMQRLSIGPAAVLGISMGGRIALDLALRYPRLVSRLILVSTAARTNKNRRVDLLALLRPIMKRGKYPQPDYAFKRQRQASANYDCTARLGEIKVPTIIMRGRRDKIVSPKLAQELQAGIKDAKTVTFSSGHMFMFMGERQEFLQAVLQQQK